jgi:hypothetical protein
MGGEVRRAKYPALQANLRELSAKDNRLAGRFSPRKAQRVLQQAAEARPARPLPHLRSYSFTI